MLIFSTKPECGARGESNSYRIYEVRVAVFVGRPRGLKSVEQRHLWG